MNRVIQYFRKKLSARVSWWVLMSVTILFVAALAIMFKYSHDAVEQESLAKAEEMLNGTVLSIDNKLHKTEVATRNMLWNVEKHLDDPESMTHYARQLVESNPDIVGCAIAFEPGYYPDRDEYYMTYAYRSESEPDVIVMTHDPTIIEPDLFKETPYMGVNWYYIPKLENTTCWVRPHAPGDTINSTVVTCGMPIHDREGHFVGVLAADISVQDLSVTVLSTRPFPDSYCVMLGMQGTYIVHPNSTNLYYKMVREEVKDEPDERVSEVVEAMLAGEDGIRSVELRGKDCYVLYKSLNNRHWSACIICPEKDIFSANRRLLLYMVAITLLGILLIFLFCWRFVSWQFAPLNMLAKSAQRITHGHYKDTIPSTSRKDEIGILQNNFSAMQTSLAHHIDQMNFLSETLKERNETLGAIHEQVREGDNMKMNLIHKIADKMILPIKGIDSVVSELDEKRSSLTRENLQSMSDEVMTHTKSITDLLDKMLEIPKKNRRNKGTGTSGSKQTIKEGGDAPKS